MNVTAPTRKRIDYLLILIAALAIFLNFFNIWRSGFRRSDPIMTVDRVKRMVANKEIKFFLLSAEGSEGAKVIAWIKAHSTEVPKSDYQGTTTAVPPAGGGGSGTLYVMNEKIVN
jgi:hypothetical protein